MANAPQLVVRELTVSDQEPFLKAYEQTAETDSNFAHYYTKGMSFEQYLYQLGSVKLGYELPQGHVPATILYAFIGSWIVGRLTLRYNLNEDMVNTVGHIGVNVIPDFRKRGYASQMMKLGLEIAKRADMPRILLTCPDGAAGEIPQKLIEKSGGVLEKAYMDPVSKVPMRRYWVEITGH